MCNFVQYAAISHFAITESILVSTKFVEFLQNSTKLHTIIANNSYKSLSCSFVQKYIYFLKKYKVQKFMLKSLKFWRKVAPNRCTASLYSNALHESFQWNSSTDSFPRKNLFGKACGKILSTCTWSIIKVGRRKVKHCSMRDEYVCLLC